MIEELRIRNYSERTVDSYVKSLSQLSKFYNLSPSDITTEQVKSFAYHLIHGKQVFRSTLHQLNSAMKNPTVSIGFHRYQDMHSGFRRYFPDRGEYLELASCRNTDPVFSPKESEIPYYNHCNRIVFLPK